MPRDTRSSNISASAVDDSSVASYQLLGSPLTHMWTGSYDLGRSNKRSRITYRDVKEMYPNFVIGPFSIKICNLRNLSKEQRAHMEPYQIIVDNSTPLGNPFHLPRLDDGSLDEDMRETVLIQYQNYFYNMVRAFGKYGHGIVDLPRATLIALREFSNERLNGKYSSSQTGYLFIRWLRYIYKALVRYGHIELWDWCAPKHCHAETIVQYLLHYYGKLYNAHRYMQMKHLRHAEPRLSSSTEPTESVELPNEVHRYMQQRLHDLGISECETDVYNSNDSAECERAEDMEDERREVVDDSEEACEEVMAESEEACEESYGTSPDNYNLDDSSY